MKIGVQLPSFGVDPSATAAEHARHAEGLGLESVWTGDHLIPALPYLDSTLVQATVAASTSRIKLGFGVLIPALRGAAWAAKQIATLQHLSGDRLIVGIGTGGEPHGDAAWRAIGVPFAERGKRTDAILAVLPDLVAGREAAIDGETVRMSPGATVPPLLIGGSGPAAWRRIERLGAGWYPAFVPPSVVAGGIQQLRDRGIEAPVTVGLSVGLGAVEPSVVADRVRGLSDYGVSEAEARQAIVVGSPTQAAAQLAAYAEAGAERVVAMPFPADRFQQRELLAEAMRQLTG
ncbi:LLM class flavin-dependent oxidoreductase [Crossiella sp. CA198]|uniref:LLM class flavin-dependent oxidoreductase n=1 Tax=Crossiella sp. CA198 TaxID=3455607 RepID=UPI003F8D4955